VGLANYSRLLEDSRFQVSVWNTAYYTVASTLPVLAIPLALAVALNRGALRTVLRSAFFFPFTLSVVTVGLTWLWLLDPVVGPFNYSLRSLGVPVRSWLADPSTAMWVVILTTVWWVTGYYLVIYLAGLQDIPRDLYEAAAIDGAGGWSSFWRITLPLLRPVLLFVFVTHIIGSFQLFGQVFVLTGGGPGDATRTVVQHLYETAFQNFFQFGAASAMAWVLFAVILAFSLLQFRLLRGHTEF
jgi:multiple sugar transport system permease protein